MNTNMSQSGFKIADLVREAQTRWLKPMEVLSILQNYYEDQLTHQPPQKPTSGSLFLFNKRVLRFFRKDGHNWRKKKDGRTVGEAHERLKVGNVEAVNCYYAHGEQNPNFQRRSYWMLDPAHEHIVLVHYREITGGKHNSGTISQSSPESPLTYSQSPKYPGSASVVGEQYEPYQSPSSVEVNSDVVNGNGMNLLDTRERNGELDVNQALQELKLQLSLNDDSLEEILTFCSENDNSNDSEQIIIDYSRSAELTDDLQELMLPQETGGNRESIHEAYTQEFAAGPKDSFFWKDMLNSSKHSPDVEFRKGDISSCMPQEVENFGFTAYSPVTNSSYTYPNSFSSVLDQGQIGINFEADCLNISPSQKYTIREICPEWGYASDNTKVVIVGSFLCDPSEASWTCMFGDVEVPVQIIQEGVLCCQAPPHPSGRVSLCITSTNGVSCSEIREFEYRVSSTACAPCNSSQTEGSRSVDELLLLVRFVQMLLSDRALQKEKLSEWGSCISKISKSTEESWSHVIEALLFGGCSSSSTTDWLLQELLKDKLQVWLSSKSQNGYGYLDCPLSKKEQGIIHTVAGLGFDWALDPILGSGININFRDINGWTALHWAARFGREKMVAALLASGASAGVVTDPNSRDPTGKTPASIAATFGYKGLAGYLSEVAVTGHLSSLTLEESDLSKGSADVEAEYAVNSISLPSNEDHLYLRDTLAAVRNTAQAAARIQAAFRAHSFRRRQQREAASVYDGIDEFAILSNDIHGLSAASKMAFGPGREHNTAALSIQKKYRGYKGRKDYLSLRQKVVKIQAHFRGHQARKQYKVCWAVGILEKVVLRWRRKGVGLRGFKQEMEYIDDSEDEDILKVFRKQKVVGAIDEAVSRVLSMVDSPDARQQYRRMLERFREAKAEREGTESEVASTCQRDFYYMENEDTILYP